MSIWMTPNLHPVYGGTYFPPGDRFYGMPGFPTILKSLAEQVVCNFCYTLTYELDVQKK